MSKSVEKPKVFCIGHWRTGTGSLRTALKILGFEPQHGKGGLRLVHFFDKETGDLDYKFFIEQARGYSSLADIPWNYMDFYKHYDKAFPNSKFILTVRDPEPWINSVISWKTRPPRGTDLRNHDWGYIQRGCINGVKTSDAFEHLNRNMYGVWDPKVTPQSRPTFIKTYVDRNKEIIRYFSERDCLLVIDITKGDGWDKLCPFLGVPVPNVPFPYEHISKK